MKSKLFFAFFLIIQNLYAQNFTEMSSPSFSGLEDSAIAFSDINGDSYNDVIIIGRTGSNSITKLCLNDGLGNFTEVLENPFENVHNGSVTFSDVNGDGYEDVFITGENDADELITKLYTNDGTGNFTEIIDTPFPGLYESSVAFSDVNGDGSEDVLISGKTQSSAITKLYSNDGMGNFTEMLSAFYTTSSLAFSDINGDGHPDICLGGSLLYINDGLGRFTLIENTLFTLSYSDFAFSDINGDGHPDILITGKIMIETPPGYGAPYYYEPRTKLYTNDGLGNFTEVCDTPFRDVQYGSVAFSDVNGDGHQDVLITGSVDDYYAYYTKLYTNDGLGNFTEVLEAPFDHVAHGYTVFSDVNGDGIEDVFIASFNNRSPKLYINDGIFTTENEVNIKYSFECIPFPNPTTSSTLHLIIKPARAKHFNIKIYNIAGALLIQDRRFKPIGQKAIPIDITSLARGTYFVELDDDNHKTIAKFIIQ